MVKNRNKVSGVETVPGRGMTLARPQAQWWRITHAEAFDEVALRKMRASLSQIEMLSEPRWKAATTGDASASIRIALGMAAAGSNDSRFDLAMTALAVCAAGGDPAACLVMAHVLRRLPGAGKSEARIATSWLVRAFGKALSHRAGADAEGAKP